MQPSVRKCSKRVNFEKMETEIDYEIMICDKADKLGTTIIYTIK